MKAKKPPTRRQSTYEEIVEKYIALGYHPLSAKAQADHWQMVINAKNRRKEREKDQ